MKITRKLGVILITLIMLLTSGVIFKNESKATTTYLINKANLYSKGEIDGFKYNDVSIGVEFVVHKKNGVEYPAYCLDRTKPGVDSKGGYSVDTKKLVTNPLIWRAINYGYPFKKPSELGCQTAGEAYAATKMAVYDMMYNYNWGNFSALNARGERIIDAASKISAKARKSSETKISSVVKVKSIKSDWEVDSLDKNYISKTYKVETNAESPKYKVSMDTTLIGAEITDKDNVHKEELKSGEVFKLLIPIKEMQNKGSIKISVTADMKTKPILYGIPENDNVQIYAVVAGEYEYEKVNIEEKYSPNKTQIEIIKSDNETKQGLEGAKFNIYNEQKELVYTDVITNDEGRIIVKEILPGKYYIEEIKSPDGYTPYEGLIEIDVKLNQKYTLNVNNNKKPETEEKEVEDNNKSVVGKKETPLPRTGF